MFIFTISRASVVVYIAVVSTSSSGSSSSAVPPAVLLLSEGVLTRPWCLLELVEAMGGGKPGGLLNLQGKRFSFDDAFHMLENLEERCPQARA